MVAASVTDEPASKQPSIACSDVNGWHDALSVSMLVPNVSGACGGCATQIVIGEPKQLVPAGVSRSASTASPPTAASPPASSGSTIPDNCLQPTDSKLATR